MEAESRKNEFAKLLEEHAQVIKELKKMEDDPPSGAVAGPTEAWSLTPPPKKSLFLPKNFTPLILEAEENSKCVDEAFMNSVNHDEESRFARRRRRKMSTVVWKMLLIVLKSLFKATRFKFINYTPLT